MTDQSLAVLRPESITVRQRRSMAERFRREENIASETPRPASYPPCHGELPSRPVITKEKRILMDLSTSFDMGGIASNDLFLISPQDAAPIDLVRPSPRRPRAISIERECEHSASASISHSTPFIRSSSRTETRPIPIVSPRKTLGALRPLPDSSMAEEETNFGESAMDTGGRNESTSARRDHPRSAFVSIQDSGDFEMDDMDDISPNVRPRLPAIALQPRTLKRPMDDHTFW